MIRKKEECNVEIRKAMKGGNGQVEVTNFATKEEMLNNARLFANLHLEPNCGIGYHIHEDETEIFYIASGEAIYNDNGTDVLVKQGDVCICEPHKGHSINTKDKACDLIASIVLK